MDRIEPREFHRIAVPVHDVGAATAWFGRVLGTRTRGGLAPDRPQTDPAVAGTYMQMLDLAGYPLLLMSGGAVASFLDRKGPGVQSFAWEIDDNWSAEHFVRDQGIKIASVSLGGRFFFMHPRDTHGVLIEWCAPPRNAAPGAPPRPPTVLGEGQPGVVDVAGLAWISAVVADADVVAEWMGSIMETTPVEGNPAGDPAVERTIDLQVGDITVRLLTPVSSESVYHQVLEGGPRVHSFGVRVADLDESLKRLEADGIKTEHRSGSLAMTDPSTTLGIPIHWTE
jgi:catechol 2,3-dioxygenase-like lactoylglutathione lyase family enzyme